MSLTLADLRVFSGYGTEDFGAVMMRSATFDDLVEVAESLGGEVRGTFYWYESHYIEMFRPGRYLVVPIPEPQRMSVDRSQVAEALYQFDAMVGEDRTGEGNLAIVVAAAREWLALSDAIEKALELEWCDRHYHFANEVEIAKLSPKVKRPDCRHVKCRILLPVEEKVTFPSFTHLVKAEDDDFLVLPVEEE